MEPPRALGRPTLVFGPAVARGVALLLAAALALGSGCSSRDGSAAESPGSKEPSFVPEEAYAPFIYSNDVQRESFAAFLDCASDQGVEMRGPFADSRGEGVLFGPADPESDTSRRDRSRVRRRCDPLMLIGIIATPGPGRFRAALFERVVRRFVSCLRFQGYPNFPMPDLGGSDTHRALEELPFEWESDRFIETVARCSAPLEDYAFSGLN